MSQLKASQVKEKFGSLRFYVAGGDEYCRGAIVMAERASARTCENCGQPGSVRKDGWHCVQCDSCNEKRVKEREKRNKEAAENAEKYRNRSD